MLCGRETVSQDVYDQCFRAFELDTNGNLVVTSTGTASATDAAGTTVNCQGQILATYGNEVQTFELSERAYLAREEAGDWRMCGYR